MDWRKVIEIAVGAAAEGARQAAGAHWDREQAEAAAKAAIRALPKAPPRQAISDADREELERIAERGDDVRLGVMAAPGDD